MNGNPFSIIASEREATKLEKFIRIQFNHRAFIFTISWVASRSSLETIHWIVSFLLRKNLSSPCNEVGE
jgi:hypothetical protein